MEENLEKSNVFFVNLTTKSVTPDVDVRRNRKKDYIYFGKDNLFPNYLIDLADNCSIHRALLETKSKFIAGEGFSFEGEDSQVDYQYSPKLQGNRSRREERRDTHETQCAQHEQQP